MRRRSRYFAPGIHERLSRINNVQPPMIEKRNELEPVELSQMVQVLSILPCGIFIALILLIFEVLIKNFKNFLKKCWK